MKQEVWWVQSLLKVCDVMFYKHKNDMHVTAALQKLCRIFDFTKI